MTTVGRVRELELLGRVLAAAERGAGGAALVQGDAGIGKSHLLDALASRSHGSTVVTGRAWEEGGAPPYWPWREVIRGLGVAIVWDATSDRFALYEQVTDALRDASRARPVLVLLDDMHAADPDTLMLTRIVARSIRAVPIAVVVAGRPSQRLAPLARDFVHVTLGPLSAPEIAAIIDRTAPSPLSRGTRGYIERVAEGNPLVATELARVGDRVVASPGLPVHLRDIVLDRVARLTAPVRESLDVAAVLGKQFDLDDVAAVLESTPSDTLGWLGTAADASVVAAAAGSHWRFTHQVIRDAVYGSISSPRRLELHAAVALHLASAGSAQRLGEQAHHLVSAVPLVDRRRAIETAVSAATQASRSRAFGAAADILDSALTLARSDADRLNLLLDLGDAQLACGRIADAWGSFDDAAALALSTRNTAARVRALLGRTERVPSTSHAGELAELIRLALEHSGTDSTPAWIRLLARYARLQAVAGDRERATAAAVDALDAARITGDDEVLCDVLTVRHLTLLGPDDVAAAREIGSELAAVAVRTANPERILDATLAQLVDHLRHGNIAGVDAALEHYRRLAGASGIPRYRFFAESRCAMRAFLAGRLAEGQAMLERAHRIGIDIEEPDTEYVVHAAQVMVLADLADPGEVLAEAQHAEAVAAATGETRLLVFAAYLRARAGDSEAAVLLIDQALTPDLAGIARDGSWLMFMCMAAYVVARSPDATPVQRFYDALQPYAGQIVVNASAVTFGGVVDHYLGMLARALSRHETARLHFDDAITTYQRLGATLFLAQVRECREELADPPRSSAEPRARQAVLQRTRDGWRCGFAENRFHLAHAIGLQHLARLILAGRELHVLQLAAPTLGTALQADSAQEILDPKAKAAYRQRIGELREELDEAEDTNDVERADRLRTELDFLLAELRSAVGLGGRDRTASTNAERARVAVRKSITATLDRLAEHDGAFAQHLRLHIRTGVFCRYEPDPTTPIEWDVSL